MDAVLAEEEKGSPEPGVAAAAEIRTPKNGDEPDTPAGVITALLGALDALMVFIPPPS